MLDTVNNIYPYSPIPMFNATSVAPTTAAKNDTNSRMRLVITLINTPMKYSEIATAGILEKFLDVCRAELELDKLPDVYITKQSEMSGSAFGEFDGSIKVVFEGRHIMDALRTLAHELVHWKQSTVGVCLDGTDGSDTENAANAIAGIIMRRFGKQHPHLF